MQCMLLLLAFDQHKSGRDFNVQLHIRAVQKAALAWQQENAFHMMSLLRRNLVTVVKKNVLLPPTHVICLFH